MPHQYGLPGFAQSPPSPPSQNGALLPRIGGGAVVPGTTGGSMTNSNSNTIYGEQIQDTRLTRDAMERYMRERNDMVIVVLHAKVRKHFNSLTNKNARKQTNRISKHCGNCQMPEKSCERKKSASE